MPAATVASRTPARGGSLGKLLGAKGDTAGPFDGLLVGFAALAMFPPVFGADSVKNPRFDKRLARSYVSRAAAMRIWRHFFVWSKKWAPPVPAVCRGFHAGFVWQVASEPPWLFFWLCQWPQGQALVGRCFEDQCPGAQL